MKVDQLLDLFVEKVNTDGHKPARQTGLSRSISVGPRNRFGVCEWGIHPSKGNTWVQAVEAKLPARFPPSFRALVTRYVYPAFEVGELGLFANTGQKREDNTDEMSVAIFKDKVLSEALLNEGYIHFARPSGGNYDPICFDTKWKSGTGEYPITWIDHESILCYDRIRVVKEVAASFSQFAETFLHQE